MDEKGDSGERRYSEEEFALILRRASELQEPGGRVRPGPAAPQGLTLSEIESIAREVGIEPEAVRKAAAVLPAKGREARPGLAGWIFGGSGDAQLEIEVAGRVLPEELGRVLEEIRRAAGHQGEASEVLGGVEWKTVGQLSAIHVNLTPRGEKTSIQIVGDRSAAGAMVFTVPLAVGTILTGALGGLLEPATAVGVVSLVGGVMGSAFALSRTLWVRGNAVFKRRLTALMEVVVEAVERATGEDRGVS